MKWSLVSLDSLNPNSEKMEGIYKSNNFIKYIAFGDSLFVLDFFCLVKSGGFFLLTKKGGGFQQNFPIPSPTNMKWSLPNLPW